MHNKKVQGLFVSLKIQQVFLSAYPEFSSSGAPQSDIQRRAAHAIMHCKSGKLCYNRSLCPNCQAVRKEIWADRRRAEVIDAPYFHVVFTLPHELNPLIICQPEDPLRAFPQVLR